MSVDPGINASAALLRRDWNRHGRFDYRILDMVDLETCEDGTNRQIDVAALGALIERWNADHAVIENVQPMPSIPGPDGLRRSMGAASAFRFGMAAGMIRATILAYEIPLTLVHPISWKRHFGLKGPDKQQSAPCLLQYCPEAAQFITLKKHHGRAEAGLLALYHAQKTGFV